MVTKKKKEPKPGEKGWLEDSEKWWTKFFRDLEIITDTGSFTCDKCGNHMSFSKIGPAIMIESENERIKKAFPEGSFICPKCGKHEWLRRYVIDNHNYALKLKKRTNRIIDSIFNFKINKLFFWRAT